MGTSREGDRHRSEYRFRWWYRFVLRYVLPFLLGLHTYGLPFQDVGMIIITGTSI